MHQPLSAETFLSVHRLQVQNNRADYITQNRIFASNFPESEGIGACLSEQIVTGGFSAVSATVFGNNRPERSTEATDTLQRERAPVGRQCL